MKRISIIIAISLLALASIFLVRYYNDNRRANFSDSCVLYVYPDMSSQQVLDSLDEVAVNTRSLARCFRKEDVASKIKPGRYVIKPEFTSIYVARMLNFGWQTPQNLTLSGTIRKKGVLARKISNQMMVDLTLRNFLPPMDSRRKMSSPSFFLIPIRCIGQPLSVIYLTG